jgi:glyoxylase-like metal-dependent hydrolase (beta-lactamase superfamily II)
MTMFFRQLFDPESSTYTYLLGDEVSREAAVIDPVRERTAEILAALKEAGFSLHLSLETHVHADHVTGGGDLRTATGARLGMHALANECHCADLSLRGGDECAVGALRIRVLETPGHTSESVSYLVGTMVFTGDALLVGTCGRTDFQGGDAGALFDSIHDVLFALPDDVVVYPGHDYQGHKSTTIGAEKLHNKRAVGRTRAEFIALMNGLNLPPPKKLAEAVPANRHCGLDGTPHSA